MLDENVYAQLENAFRNSPDEQVSEQDRQDSGIRITEGSDGAVVCQFDSGSVISIAPDGSIKRVSFASPPLALQHK